jgi:hypothetical protein
MKLDPKPKPVQSVFHSRDHQYDTLDSLRKHFDFESISEFFWGKAFARWVHRQDPLLADKLESLPREARKLEKIKLFFSPGADGVQTKVDLVRFWMENGYADNARRYLRSLVEEDIVALVRQIGGDRFFSLLAGSSGEGESFLTLLSDSEAQYILPVLIDEARRGDATCSEVLLKGTESLRKRENLSPSAIFSLYELVLDYRLGLTNIRQDAYDPSVAEVARFFSTVLSIRQTLSNEENQDRWAVELVNADACASTGGPLVRDFYKAFLVVACHGMSLGDLRNLENGQSLTIIPKLVKGQLLAVWYDIGLRKLREDCEKRGDSPQDISRMLDDYCRNYLNWLQDV